MVDSLTPKMEAFSQGCLDPDNSESDAYKLAYNTENMSAQVIYNEASKLAKLPKVAARIAELRAALAEQVGVTKADILQELKGIGFGNLADLVEWSESGVTLNNSKELTPELTALVAEVSETKHGVKIKLHDKIDALDKMAKMTGAYDKLERPGDVRISSIVINMPGTDESGQVVEAQEWHQVGGDGVDVPVEEGG